MKYNFGIMDNVWELESEDFTTAYVAMALHVKKNIPVAVYKLQKYGFMPKDILEANQKTINPHKLLGVMKTIKSIDTDDKGDE